MICIDTLKQQHYFELFFAEARSAGYDIKYCIYVDRYDRGEGDIALILLLDTVLDGEYAKYRVFNIYSSSRFSQIFYMFGLMERFIYHHITDILSTFSSDDEIEEHTIRVDSDFLFSISDRLILPYPELSSYTFYGLFGKHFSQNRYWEGNGFPGIVPGRGGVITFGGEFSSCLLVFRFQNGEIDNCIVHLFEELAFHSEDLYTYENRVLHLKHDFSRSIGYKIYSSLDEDIPCVTDWLLTSDGYRRLRPL